MSAQHIVNISGGKDSQACALLAAERGRPFRLVMADTGNELPPTLDHALYIADFVGVPLEIVRADFTARIEAKRRYVAEHWTRKGVPQDRVDRALAALVSTGNPFLDLCLWKGRFPSRKAQFCTEFLKQEAVEQQVVGPALDTAPVIQWIGVRRDESLNRRNAPMFQRVARPDQPHDMVLFRPLIHWTAANVIAYSQASGARHNPLYSMGMSRVGCVCINAGKEELRQIAIRFPEAVERIVEWEAIAAEASKRGAATFFAADVTPEGDALGRKVKRDSATWVRRHHPDVPETIEGCPNPAFGRLAKARASEISATSPWPHARQVFDWARTARGGRQFDMLEYAFASDEGLSCTSQYGLCE